MWAQGSTHQLGRDARIDKEKGKEGAKDGHVGLVPPVKRRLQLGVGNEAAGQVLIRFPIVNVKVRNDPALARQLKGKARKQQQHSDQVDHQHHGIVGPDIDVHIFSKCALRGDCGGIDARANGDRAGLRHKDGKKPANQHVVHCKEEAKHCQQLPLQHLGDERLLGGGRAHSHGGRRGS